MTMCDNDIVGEHRIDPETQACVRCGLTASVIHAQLEYVSVACDMGAHERCFVGTRDFRPCVCFCHKKKG